MQHQRFCQPRQCQKTATTETTAPKSTSAVRSVVQIPPVTWHPQTEVSCSKLGKNTEDSCCFQTVWSNCAGLIARPL